MADIIELVLADHDRIRRLMGALDNAARYGELGGANWVVAQAWQRLAGLLDVHTAAGGHEPIRAALQQVRRHDIGTQAWWGAVTVLLRACSEHLDAWAELEPQAGQHLR